MFLSLYQLWHDKLAATEYGKQNPDILSQDEFLDEIYAYMCGLMDEMYVLNHLPDDETYMGELFTADQMMYLIQHWEQVARNAR